MSSPNPSATNPIPRPGWGCFFFTAPLAFALLVSAAYAILFGVGMQGTSARGDRVAIAFETCPQARALLSERVTHIGLGDPVFTATPTGLQLQVTLPEGPAAAHIPTTLARTGHFAIRSGDAPDGPEVLTRADVVTAEFSLKEMGNPLVLLRITPGGRKALEAHMEGDPDGRIGVWIDDEPVLLRGNTPPFRRPEIDVRAEGTDGIDNMRRAVDWGMLITYGPLPCPTAVTAVTPLTE